MTSRDADRLGFGFDESQTETVTIASLGHEGDGVAQRRSGPVYVPFTLPGERAEIERAGDRGTLVRLLDSSPERVPPVCRHFGICGGCAIQHWATAPAAAWKRDLVAAAFAQRGIDTPVAATLTAPLASRRRLVLAAERKSSGAVVEFHRARSHNLIAIEECPIAVPEIAGQLPLLRAIAGVALPRGGRGRVTVVAAGNGLDVAVEVDQLGRTARGRSAGRNDRTRSRAGSRPFPTDPAIARLAVNGEVVILNRRPEIGLGADASLLPVPGGFLQASAAAEAALAQTVLDGVATGITARHGAPIADLFAGIGTFSLRLARLAPVLAVESDPDAAAAAEDAARRARGLKAITVRRRDLVHNPLAPPELAGFAAVVFDPPRAGARAQAEMLARSDVPAVVAVSCNPATLARDARILIDGGYRLTSVQPVDQFRFSAHVEAVAAFVR